MHIILQKPSLSFALPPAQCSPKSVTLYTNTLPVLSRRALLRHLIDTNKISALHPQLTKPQHSRISAVKHINQLYLRPLVDGCAQVLELLLENDEDVGQYLIKYPLVLELRYVEYEGVINNRTAVLGIKENFEMLRMIGQGSFARVYLAREYGTEYLRAVKVVNKEDLKHKGDMGYIRNELGFLKAVQSVWQVKFYYAFEDEANFYFVFEYCPYGDLLTYLVKYQKQLSLHVKYFYFIQICLGLCRIHEKGYIYRDLKPENILIDYKGHIKFCDFGYTIASEPHKLHYELCGSYEYIPPELITKQGYNHSYDLYCLGLLFYEILTGTNPFKGINSKNLGELYTRQVDYELPGVDASAKDLIRRLMDKTPAKRLGYASTTDIFRHNFFHENGKIVMNALNTHYVVRKQVQIQQSGPTQAIKIETKVKNKQQGERQKVQYILGGQIHNSLATSYDVGEKPGPRITQYQVGNDFQQGGQY